MPGWSHRLLRSGEFRLDAGAMFGMIPRVVWTKWLQPDEHNRMTLSQNSLLLEREGRLVLIETGIGDKMSEKEQSLYAQDARTIRDALHEADCSPEDIDAVVLTHLHFDHAGGLTHLDEGGKPVPTFPNAEVVVQQREWDDAIANRSTMHKTYLPSHLTPEIAERLTLVEGEEEIMPGMWVIPTPGHTWGQQCIAFEDDRSDAHAPRYTCFVSDVMPTHWHNRPTSNMAYDVEPYTGMQSRVDLLRRASEGEWRLTLVHEPGEALRVPVADEKRLGEYVLEPAG